MITKIKTYEQKILMKNVNEHFEYYINQHTGLFVIENNIKSIELVQEDLIAIKEILNKKYNTYYSQEIEIYLFNNTLYISNLRTDTTLEIYSNEFENLIKIINSKYKSTSPYNEICDDEFNCTKKNIEDYIRYSKKYNL